jgi:tRNA pseudouridine38-40 synthase
MMRWKITIEYFGGMYCGWQTQNIQKTVQGEIELAIQKFCQQDIRIHAAGRTDTGVHALGQVAHFDLDYGTRALSGFDLAKAINAHLRPQPISILKAEEARPDFHARFDATNKLYRYKIVNRVSPLGVDQGHAWHIWKPLDDGAMHRTAQHLLGQHDFSTFRDSECQAKTPVRTIDKINVTRNGDDVVMEVEARSFLHHQVRNTIGTLAMVGEGKWSEQDFITAFKACDRTKGGVTAPPDGLTLVRIDYPSA